METTNSKMKNLNKVTIQKVDKKCKEKESFRKAAKKESEIEKSLILKVFENKNSKKTAKNMSWHFEMCRKTYL